MFASAVFDFKHYGLNGLALLWQILSAAGFPISFSVTYGQSAFGGPTSVWQLAFLAKRRGILPSDTHRMLALLRHRGVIDH